MILPEVPEWRELSLEPQLALPTVQCSITALKDDPGVQDRPYGLMGFSFSAPHALAVAAAEEVRADIAGVVGFGGYYDLERTIAFMLTGRHEYAGKAYQLIPDPYGRWIVAANYLNNIPGHEEATDVEPVLDRRPDGAEELVVRQHLLHVLARALRTGFRQPRRGSRDRILPGERWPSRSGSRLPSRMVSCRFNCSTQLV